MAQRKLYQYFSSGLEKNQKEQIENHDAKNKKPTEEVPLAETNNTETRGRKRERAEDIDVKDKTKIRNKQYEDKRKRTFNESWTKFYPWVVHDIEKDHMYCEYCRKFPRLADHKSTLYLGCGSNGQFREESLKAHSLSKSHTRCTGEWENQTLIQPGSAPRPLEKLVEEMTKKLDDTTQGRMRKLFNTAYYTGKQEKFSKFEHLCELQEKNGIDLGTKYKNRDKCKQFIDTIADVETSKIKDCVSESRFLCILSDGSTDSAVIEQETVFVRYVNSDGIPTTDFVDLVPLGSADANSVLEGILRGLKSVRIGDNELKSKLIGCNFDGAAVMLGKKGGVATKLENKVEHPIVKIHCVAHNLELGFLDAVKKIDYISKFQDTIHQIYKFYHYSPKRRREMKEVAEILEESPIMQTGLQKTRWVASRHRAVKAVINSFPTIITHLENSSNGKGEEAAKVKGYLKEIKSSKFLHFAHFLCDVLSELSNLSKQFQSDLLIINEVKVKIELCLLKLETLKTKDGDCYVKFKEMFNGEESVLTCGKQNFKCEVTKSTMNFKKYFDDFIDKAIQYIRNRFQSLDETPMNEFGVFDYRLWPANRTDLLGLGDAEVKRLCDFFSAVLTEEEKHSAQKEWLELKVRVSPVRSVIPVELYSSLLKSKPESLANILLLVQIMLTISPTTAKCERSFSSMKQIKTVHRSTLSQKSLTSIMRLRSMEVSLMDFDPDPAIAHWMKQTKTTRHVVKVGLSKKRTGMASKPDKNTSLQAGTSENNPPTLPLLLVENEDDESD